MSISNTEWEITRVVWTREETTNSQTSEILEQRTDWTASAVKILLKRLVDKGYLATQKSGKPFLYSAPVFEEGATSRQADELLDKFYQRKRTAIIKHLVEATPMTMADINDLQALLLSKKEEAFEEIPCNCIPG